MVVITLHYTTYMIDIFVARERSPSTYFNIVKRKLLQDNEITLTALEGAIVVAVDAANMLSKENIANIVSISTGSVEVSLHMVCYN